MKKVTNNGFEYFFDETDLGLVNLMRAKRGFIEKSGATYIRGYVLVGSEKKYLTLHRLLMVGLKHGGGS